MVSKQIFKERIVLSTRDRLELEQIVNTYVESGWQVIGKIRQENGNVFKVDVIRTDDTQPIEIIKEVEVPVEVEKIVEVPVEVIREVEVPVEVEKIVEVPADPNLQDKTIVENGEYTADENYDGLGSVVVNVPETIREVEVEKIVEVPANPNLQSKTITENGEYSADEGYDGLGEVIVNVPETIREIERIVEVPVQPTLSVITITENGEYTPPTGVDGFSKIIVQTHTHTFADAWTYDDTYHWHEPTCGHTDIVGNKAAHNLPENWTERLEENKYTIKYKKCSICNYEKIYGQEYEDLFDITYDGILSVKDPIDLPNDVIIPYTIRGVRVKVISDSCFKDVNRMTSIQLPDSITAIMAKAFYNCSSLNTFIIPDNITLQEQTFINSAKYIYVPDHITYNKIANNPDFNSSTLEIISIPKTLNIFREQHITRAENIQKIIYRGTIEELNAMDKSNHGWNNSHTWQDNLNFMYGKPIECLDGSIIVQENTW